MGSNAAKTEREERLCQLAHEVMSEISELNPSQREELLGVFVSELYLLERKQKRREVCRQKQAAGIAAAKERGVQFGRERVELSEDFPELARLWQEGSISSRRAAEELGISHHTFIRRAREYCAV